MAPSGAPIAHEDHPHRGLRAALAIQAALTPLRDDVRRRHGVDFRLRIGLNTGLVVVGAIGRDLRMDYTAIGDTTNLAARILNIAQPGQIALSAITYRLTEGYFAFEDLGEFQVKGKTEPIQVYAVTAERKGRTRLEVSRDRGLTPFVGRQHELDLLLGAFRRAAADRARPSSSSASRAQASPGSSTSFRTRRGVGRLAPEGSWSPTALRSRTPDPRSPATLPRGRRFDADELRRSSPTASRRSASPRRHRVLLAHFLGRRPARVPGEASGAELKARTFGVP
jgi:hypothetical protein